MANHPNGNRVALAGALVTLIVYILSLCGIEVPGDVAAALLTIILAGLLYAGKKRPS